MRVTFREVAQHRSKSVSCAGGCGRKLKRQKKFYQTLSPFNKNKAGTVKTSSEIHAELDKEFAAWKDAPETCSHCKGQQTAAPATYLRCPECGKLALQDDMGSACPECMGVAV